MQSRRHFSVLTLVSARSESHERRISREQIVDRHPPAGNCWFGLGDISGALGTDYLQRLGLEPPAVVRAWRDRCFEVPAMATALAEALPRVTAMLESRRARMATA